MVMWLFAVATFGTALRAAWYWYRSSQVAVAPYWREVSKDEWLDAAMRASTEAANLNRWGAIWTAASTVLGAATVTAAAWFSSN
jgi:hypothetical protein